jgi:hypothetical protein
MTKENLIKGMKILRAIANCKVNLQDCGQYKLVKGLLCEDIINFPNELQELKSLGWQPLDDHFGFIV